MRSKSQDIRDKKIVDKYKHIRNDQPERTKSYIYALLAGWYNLSVFQIANIVKVGEAKEKL